MTPSQCSHCGKPCFTGLLCSDCQALRAYQPHLFAAAGGSGGTISRLRLDRSAIFGAILVVFACFGMVTLWPLIQKMLTQPTSKIDTSASVIDKFKKLGLADAYRKELNDDTSAPMPASSPPSNQSAPPPPPATTIVASAEGNTHVTTSRPKIVAAMVDQDPGNWKAGARESFDTFLAQYCGRRSTLVGGPVKPTSILWLTNGTGVVVTLDERGTFRQGTAEYNAETGWGWILAPEAQSQSR